MEVEAYNFREAMKGLTKSKWIIVSVYLMLISYFYNLPVLNYSARGNNELRLYDVAGVVVIYLYFKYMGLVNKLIENNKALNNLFHFLMWANFTIIFTIIDSILEDKIYWALQSIKYLFHFWAFFIVTVFLQIIIQDLAQLKRIVNFTLIMASVCFLVVVLQNFGIIPFLWSDDNWESYNGFLSGTLGPNKIVLGMTSLFVFTLAVGLLNDKRIKMNKTILMVTIVMSLLVLVMSGSRTSYVGLLVFLGYFFIRETISFIYSAIALVILAAAITAINPKIIEKAVIVYEGRVENKIRDPQSLREAKVESVYEDLGSGRKGLSVLYIGYLMENPGIIPFGLGFNNRLSLISSAHNTYLSLINEVGIVGVIFYFRWLFSYLGLKMSQFPKMRMALKGLVLSMLVTLFFGEHLYIYRPLFGLLGLFLFITTLLLSPILILYNENEDRKAT
ncbi:MAG TPA: hypothetical protein VK528_01290 [Flavobacterium sp.]|nr:hypothetical protein [Flavobacterium sp.]